MKKILPRITLLIFPLSFVCGLSGFARASYITIETNVTTTIQNNNLLVKVRVVNRGNEAARSIQVKSEFGSSTAHSPIQDMILPGNTVQFTLHHSLSGAQPGRHVLIQRVYYTDINAYPFSALSVVPFSFREEIIPTVMGLLDSARLETHARLTLKIKNLASDRRPVSLRLVTPQEISSDTSPIEAVLGANQEREFIFSIHNFSALGNSTYPVYVIAEYDQQGRHVAFPILGLVKIHTEDPLRTTTRWMPWVMGLLFISLLGLNVWKFLSKKR